MKPIVEKPAPASQELVFCSDPWLPYVGFEGTSKEGYVLDILREVYQPLGYRVRLVNKPWTRCTEDARVGKIDGLTQSEPNEAQGFVFSQEPIWITRPTFFVRDSFDWKFVDVTSLLKIRLAVIQSYTYEKSIDEYIKKTAKQGA